MTVPVFKNGGPTSGGVMMFVRFIERGRDEIRINALARLVRVLRKERVTGTRVVLVVELESSTKSHRDACGTEMS